MGCLGVFIDKRAIRALFNYELALRQGWSLVERNDFGGDPEIMRQQVEAGLRHSHPFVTVSFWDNDSELDMDTPLEGHEFCLLIKQETPMYSACMH